MNMRQTVTLYFLKAENEEMIVSTSPHSRGSYDFDIRKPLKSIKIK